MSHNHKILTWLKRGQPITHREAYSQLGCARLAARIHELRQEGHQITTERYTTPLGSVVARYWMGAK